MQGQDKVNQLKKSIQARKAAEAKQQESASAELSPGMQAKFEEKIASLEQSLNESQAALSNAEEAAAEAKDQFVRKHAEFENFRKRMEREKLEATKYGQEKFTKELLPVMDSLEKAIQHAEEEAQSETTSEANNSALLEGVQLVEKQFLQVLEKFGVRPIPSVGETFDPNVHEAVGQVESSESPPNTIAEEYRRGYTLHDRVLRAAMVAVVK